MWKELIKKVELQSILVFIVTLSFGYSLFKIDKTFSSATGILGSIIISFGAIYTFVSFFTINIRESYKDVISEYKSTIETMRLNYEAMHKGYKETLESTTKAHDVVPTNYRRQIEETTSE